MRILALCFSLALPLAATSANASAENLNEEPAGAKKHDQSTYTVVDVERLSRENPAQAIKTFQVKKPDRTIRCDILIAGGGVAGVAAAARILKNSPQLRVCLTEETNWLGGQMTSQGVCALDENSLVETSGACLSYQAFRQAIRDFYKSGYKLSSKSQDEVYFNPGNCWVTRLAFEPKVALRQIDKMLAGALSGGSLQIFRREKIVHIDSASSGVRAALAINLDSGESIQFKPKICLDATELGDLLPLAGVAYSIGSDSHSQTEEPHAPPVGNPNNVQGYVFPFVVEFKPATDNSIAKPEHFDEFESQGKFGLMDYKMFDDSVIQDTRAQKHENGRRTVQPFWTYRRLIDKTAFADPLLPFDVSMINWESNDLAGYNIIDQPPAAQAERLALAKSLSLGFLYWLQNDAPRDEGGVGYKELTLRTDVLGTADGLSMYPYIREARRIHAQTTIIEQDIAASQNPQARAKLYNDTVGIGQYEIDIHGHEEIPGTGQPTKPFQIPLGALIPERGGNLLPAGKDIGVTHITNGAYRLHPIEWAIGEAQGALTSYCLEHNLTPAEVRLQTKHLRALQRSLIENGAPVFWFDDLPTNHPAFAGAQFAALTELLPANPEDLHFGPDRQITIGESAIGLARVSGLLRRTAAGTASATDSKADKADIEAKAIETCQKHKIFSRRRDWRKDRLLTVSDLEEISRHHHLIRYKSTGPGDKVTRADFAIWLYAQAKHAKLTM